LGITVNRLFGSRIENPEVRYLLLQIIGAGKIKACADIAYEVAMDRERAMHERSLGIEALLQLDDPRIESLAHSLETDAARWPDAVARRAMLHLFPTYMPIPRLETILGRVREARRTIGELSYGLPRDIETANLSPDYLNELRQAVDDLIVGGTTWERDKHPHLRTRRPDLMAAHIAACRRQCNDGTRTPQWIASALLAVRLSKNEYQEQSAMANLRSALAKLSPDARETAFWAKDAFLQRLHKSEDAWHRVYDLSEYGGIQLNTERDGEWVRKRLSDSEEPIDHREMMLWVEMNLLRRNEPDHRNFLDSLRPLVADAPSLGAIIDNRLTPQEGTAELRRMQARQKKRNNRAKRDESKAHASWVTFLVPQIA
jgi:hypothetical protein